MKNLDNIRRNLENFLLNHGHKYDFKHPKNGRIYQIHTSDGLIKIYDNKAKTCKIMTWDGLLHLWLENPDYKE